MSKIIDLNQRRREAQVRRGGFILREAMPNLKKIVLDGRVLEGEELEAMLNAMFVPVDRE